jgi:nucleoside-diphosphate-sugar epimerase
VALYLVTGGAGFIGSHLAEAIVNRGDCVRILDNFSTGKRENLAGLSNNSQVEIIEGDLQNLAEVRSAVDGVEVVFHQAALPSVPRSVKDPAASNDVNVSGTLNMLIAARDSKVRRVVYASSSSAYGNTKKLPKHESMRPQPLSPYAVSKLGGEQYCMAFWHTYGLETVALRYFNVFGPRQDPNSQYSAVIPRFIASLLQDISPTIYGDGLQERDFTYIANVVHANLLAASAPKAAGAVVNIACGESHSLLALLDGLAQLIGRTVVPDFQPARPGDVLRSLADIRAAKRLLHYSPQVSFQEGLKRTSDWFSEERR